MQTFTLNIGLRTSLNQFNEETRGAEFALTEQDQKFEALMACALLGGLNPFEVREVLQGFMVKGEGLLMRSQSL